MIKVFNYLAKEKYKMKESIVLQSQQTKTDKAE